MKKVILDTNILIAHWRRHFTCPRKKHRAKDAERWARELIKARQTDAIVTPVYVEMVCGALDQHELHLTLVFLDRFRRVDEGAIPPQDWQNAIQMAEKVSRGAEPRDLGDCLIRAIANRLGYEVKTEDHGFPE